MVSSEADADAALVVGWNVRVAISALAFSRDARSRSARRRDASRCRRSLTGSDESARVGRSAARERDRTAGWNVHSARALSSCIDTTS